MANNKQLIVALALSGLIGVVHADEKEELLKLRNTTVNLIKQLVKQGVITEKSANEMIKQAEVEAVKQSAKVPVSKSQSVTASGEAAENAAKESVPADEIRVGYVPDFVKDEIRQQVRNELREEVVGDVMQKAKQEQWGMPNALPEWVKRFTLSGDIRLREQSSMMASDNISFNDNRSSWAYLNYNAINAANNQSGGATRSNLGSQVPYLNTQQGQSLGRERFRLGIDAAVTDGVDAGIRLATGNTQNPVSTNQTLGNTGLGYQFAVDRAFVRYNAVDERKFNWLTLMGGRTPNPFFTGGSELVWDEDLSFEGVAATLRHRIGVDELADDIGGKGPTVFATAGMFPLQAQNPLTGLSTLQKWLFGGQAGIDWGFDNQDALKFGAAFYDYQGIKAQLNKDTANNQACSVNTASMTQSAPIYVQGGNSMVGICHEGAGIGNPYGLYGLASNYHILNFNFLYDLALFSPIHAKFSADYAKNVGFNRASIFAYTGLNIAEQTTAWQVKFDLGWPKVDRLGYWNVFAAYKYLERDAVLDSYTDSDFHLGGTNVKGWWIGGNYGLMKNVWLTGRWLSGEMISPTINSASIPSNYKYGIDVLQLDINTRF